MKILNGKGDLKLEKDEKGELVLGDIIISMVDYHYGKGYEDSVFKSGEVLKVNGEYVKIIRINSIDFYRHEVSIYCEYFENGLGKVLEKINSKNNKFKRIK